ncbi:MAG: alpha/beta hydrolase [Ketobacteraceae bacterium]|nr:alpha/beta hydrolase [Ketobacteraceae bacterium]
MSSQLVMVNGVLRTVVKPVIQYMSMHPRKIGQRRPLLCGAASLLPIPGHVQIEPQCLGKFKGEWIHSRKNPPETREKVVLYLHGGGYLACSPVTHRNLTTRLARYGQTRVFAINYRKSPEYPYPYALEDALHSYQWLLAEGVDPANIVIAGDSAGGNLTLVTLLAIRDKRLPLPAGGVCLSPWTDLTANGDSIHFNRGADPMIPSRKVRHAARLHANGMPLDDPRLSPIYANLEGLPPLLIHVGDNEVLLSDSTRFAAKARDSGVPVELKIWQNAPHVFQLFAGLVPQSNQSLREIGAFVQRVRGDFPVPVSDPEAPQDQLPEGTVIQPV